MTLKEFVAKVEQLSRSYGYLPPDCGGKRADQDRTVEGFDWVNDRCAFRVRLKGRTQPIDVALRPMNDPIQAKHTDIMVAEMRRAITGEV